MAAQVPIFAWEDWVGTRSLTDGFAIQRLEHLMPPDAHLIPPHRYDFYTIAWIISGSGVHTVDFTSYQLAPQTLFFTTPGQIYACRPALHPHGYVAHFTAAFLLAHGEHGELLAEFPYLHQVGSAPLAQVPAPAEPLLHDLFGHLESEAHSSALRHEELVRLYLRALLIQIQRLASTDGSQSPVRPSTRLLQRFLLLREAHFYQTTRVADYATQLGVTAKHLSETVKAETGKTAGALIQERVLLEAQRLLAYSGLTVSEIALYLGFSDPAYFWRFFRRHTQQSPGAFRAAHPYSVQSLP